MPDSRSKKKAILDRIKQLEEAIAKANEYLESGKHANWSGFRPWFAPKIKDGKRLPPHKEWVRNVFLPRAEKALNRAESIIEELSSIFPRAEKALNRAESIIEELSSIFPRGL